MRSLPVPVSEVDIEEMFNFSDKNRDGKLSYKEFEVFWDFSVLKTKYIYFFLKIMMKPQAPPEVVKPHITEVSLETFQIKW